MPTLPSRFGLIGTLFQSSDNNYILGCHLIPNPSGRVGILFRWPTGSRLVRSALGVTNFYSCT